eukprot:3822783-Heterocapsa_arctica.AAC.1
MMHCCASAEKMRWAAMVNILGSSRNCRRLTVDLEQKAAASSSIQSLADSRLWRMNAMVGLLRASLRTSLLSSWVLRPSASGVPPSKAAAWARVTSAG